MRVESELSKTYVDMSKRAGKRKQGYVDHLRYRLKLTCIIHGPGNSSDECKVLNYFGSKYTKSRDYEENGQDPAFKKKFGNSKKKMLWSNMQLMISYCKKIKIKCGK